MTSDPYLRWSKIVCGSWLAGLGLIVASSYVLDSYGLFRGSHRTPPQVYGGERTSKYLLSTRYVPASFDSLMLGASISANWNTKRITSARVYNASISGGNLAEEKIIADNVLKRGHLRWLIVCIHPYLTMTRGRKTEHMVPRDYWSAFGSLELFVTEASELATKAHVVADKHNEFGDSDYDNHTTREGARAAMEAYIAERIRSGRPHANFVIAPGALDDLRDLQVEAQSAGVRVALVVPPVYSERMAVERADWVKYWAAARAEFPADTPYLNFNDPPFDDGVRELANFQDTGHLRRTYSDRLVDELGRFLAAQSAGQR